MNYDYKLLTDVSKMKRDEVVPYYSNLIENLSDPFSREVIRINNLILSKWSKCGLEYIKNKAWSFKP